MNIQPLRWDLRYFDAAIAADHAQARAELDEALRARAARLLCRLPPTARQAAMRLRVSRKASRERYQALHREVEAFCQDVEAHVRPAELSSDFTFEGLDD